LFGDLKKVINFAAAFGGKIMMWEESEKERTSSLKILKD